MVNQDRSAIGGVSCKGISQFRHKKKKIREAPKYHINKAINNTTKIGPIHKHQRDLEVLTKWKVVIRLYIQKPKAWHRSIRQVKKRENLKYSHFKLAAVSLWSFLLYSRVEPFRFSLRYSLVSLIKQNNNRKSTQDFSINVFPQQTEEKMTLNDSHQTHLKNSTVIFNKSANNADF